MPDYLISVAHHSVSRSRVVKYSGSLAGAKRRASAEFGGNNLDYVIQIHEAKGDSPPVATRLVRENRWRIQPQSEAEAHRLRSRR